MVNDVAELDILQVDLGEGIVAGFTNRKGGVSNAPWEGLNLGLNVGDERGDVLANRRLLAEYVGAPVSFVRQVHGVNNFEPSVAGTDPFPVADQCTEPGADIQVTDSPEIALGILAADCMPILYADPVNRVVGVAHAGRVGFLAGVATKALQDMQRQGADISQVRVAIGPSIAGVHYEVAEEMARDAEQISPGVAVTTLWNTVGLEIREQARKQLVGQGVKSVELVPISTWENSDYYSYRRDGQTGRFAGFVKISPEAGNA